MARFFPKKKMLKKRVYRKKPRGTKNSFAKRVKAVLSKVAEDKTAVIQYDNQSCNSGIDVAGDYRPLIPSIIQSVGEGGRIGNRIRAKYIEVKGHILMSAIATTTALSDYISGTIPPNARLGVRLMCLTGKKNIDMSTQNTTYNSYLLSVGTTQSGYTGLVRDLYTSINTELLNIQFDKVFKMTTPILYRMNTTSPAGATSQDNASSAGSIKFFSFRIPLRGKVLNYTDAEDLPVNYRPHLCLGYSHLDGSSPDVLTTAVKLSFVSKLVFEDV